MSIKKILSWAVVILWMGVLFYLSSQVQGESNELSVNVSKALVDRVGSSNSGNGIDLVRFNHILRENAHYIVYFILGFLVMNASRKGVQSLVISVLYGISDEIHQIFVPGRGAEMQDVINDSIGALAGIIFFIIFIKAIEIIRNRWTDNENISHVNILQKGS